jgi:hypothetical protein
MLLISDFLLTSLEFQSTFLAGRFHHPGLPTANQPRG